MTCPRGHTASQQQNEEQKLGEIPTSSPRAELTGTNRLSTDKRRDAAPIKVNVLS